MLAAYFDESGTHKGSNWVAVAGYVADASAWVRYDKKWKSELTAYQLPFFHMKEFVRNQKGYRWGTSQRRNRFAKLQGITRRTVRAGIAVVLDVSAWKTHVVTPKDQRYFGTSYYEFCATASLGMVAKWCEDQDINEGVDYTYEQGASGWKQFRDMYDKCYADEKLRGIYRMLGGLGLKDKRLFPPLQCADIAAYCLHKAGPSVANGKGTGWGVPELADLNTVRVYRCVVDDNMFRMMKLHPQYLKAK